LKGKVHEGGSTKKAAEDSFLTHRVRNNVSKKKRGGNDQDKKEENHDQSRGGSNTLVRKGTTRILGLRKKGKKGRGSLLMVQRPSEIEPDRGMCGDQKTRRTKEKDLNRRASADEKRKNGSLEKKKKHKSKAMNPGSVKQDRKINGGRGLKNIEGGGGTGKPANKPWVEKVLRWVKQERERVQWRTTRRIARTKRKKQTRRGLPQAPAPGQRKRSRSKIQVKGKLAVKKE